MARCNPVEHRFARFLRRAMAVIVDAQEFPGIGTGRWWAPQTVTTVGYRDDRRRQNRDERRRLQHDHRPRMLEPDESPGDGHV